MYTYALLKTGEIYIILEYSIESVSLILYDINLKGKFNKETTKTIKVSLDQVEYIDNNFSFISIRKRELENKGKMYA